VLYLLAMLLLPLPQGVEMVKLASSV